MRVIDLQHRTGVTLVEVLVVLSIIGVLSGLIFPAVHMARESARRVDCQNRIKQIGLAVQHFESAHRWLPSNGWGYRWMADPSRGIGRTQPGGWVYQIAAFCEHPLPNTPTRTLGSDYQLRSELSAIPFPLTRCPSRSGNAHSPASIAAAPHNAAFVALVPKTDYAANEGDFITNTDGGPKSLQEGDSPGFRWKPTERATGVIFLRSQIRWSDVGDGLSTTYLVGEKYVSSSHYHDGKDLGYDQSLYCGVDLDLNRWTIQPPYRDSRGGHVREFGSAHPSGCNMVLCDGSVKLVNYSVDTLIHRKYGTRNGR